MKLRSLQIVKASLLLFCLLFLSCEYRVFWGKRVGDCDPAKIQGIQASKRWGSTLQSSYAPGCLRISWGKGKGDAVGLYVALFNNGKLIAHNPATNAFDAPIQTPALPKEVEGKERSFKLFLFGDSVKPGQQASFCQKNMGSMDYICELSEQGACWLSLAFQPSPQDAGLKASVVPVGCHWRSSGILEKVRTEQSSERQSEHAVEQTVDSHPEQAFKEVVIQEPTPDAGIPEVVLEPSVELKESTVEVLPEPVPEKPPVNVLWSRRAGSTSNSSSSSSETAEAIVTDRNGDVYVAGTFAGSGDFGTMTHTSFGGYDAFVAKLDASGNWLWVRTLGGSSNDKGLGVGVDAQGNVYFVGEFYGTAQAGTIKLQAPNNVYRTFVAKLDTKGKWLWVEQASGTGSIHPTDIAVDNVGNLFVTGRFYQHASFGKYTLTSAGNVDIFVAKMDTSGSWSWASQGKGKGANFGKSIAIDGRGNVYATGSIRDSVTFGSFTIQTPGVVGAFVGQLDGSSGKWKWITQTEGSTTSVVNGRAIAVSGQGETFIIGDFASDVVFGSVKVTTPSNTLRGFVAKYTNKGKLLWFRDFGAQTIRVYGESLGLDLRNDVYITGSFTKSMVLGTTKLTATGDNGVFVAKLDSLGAWLWAKRGTGTKGIYSRDLTTDGRGGTLISGGFNGVVTLDKKNHTAKGVYDIFLWKTKPPAP